MRRGGLAAEQSGATRAGLQKQELRADLVNERVFMPIKTYRPLTPTLRFQTKLTNDELTTNRPHKPLTSPKQRTGGRRNAGDITLWHRGGGHKRKLRLIDFKRDKAGIAATVVSIEYDPNRSARIALLSY